jgi:diguanylate cyclase (GGDEF)-like protein
MTLRYDVLALAAAYLLAGGQAGHSEASSADPTPPLLTNVNQIRRLTPEQARKGFSVRLRAVVTYFDAVNMFVHDPTGGIWVARSPTGLTAEPGQLLDLQGVTTQTDFAPDVAEPRWSVVGRAALPKALRASMDLLASSTVDSEWVELEGVVRSAQITKDGRIRFILQIPGGRVVGYIPENKGIPQGLVDSRVRIRGVCGAIFTQEGQIVGVNLFVPQPDEIQILEAGPTDPFALASGPIGRLQRFNLSGLLSHRLKVQGVVTAQFPGNDLYIADQSGSVYVTTSQTSQLRPGDRVEVVGFVGVLDYRPVVQDAIYRVDGSGPPPAAASIAANQGLSDKYDSKLVTVKGLLQSLSVVPDGRLLALDDGGIAFSAVLRGQRAEPGFYFQAGSLLQATGICLIDRDAAGLAQSFKIRLRSSQDVVLIESPSWWSVGRALSVMSLLAAITLGILVWVVAIRRQVKAQTKDLVVKTVKLELANQTTQKALHIAREAESLEVDRQRVLELVARDEPIEQVLDQLAATAAAHCSNAVCAILVHLLEGPQVSSVPLLPADWQAVLKQISIDSISVGAGFRELRQFSQDPVWERLLETHLPCRFRTFSCAPILVNGRMAGVIAAFFADKSPPDAQPELLGSLSKLAGLALERRSLYEQLSFRAQYDLLTGLPNRPHLYERLNSEIALAVLNGGLLGVIYIDLDGFKEVNDIQGHAAGDAVLQEIAARMARIVRRGDTVGRIGGDEFVMVLPHLGSRSDAERIAAKISGALQEPIYFNNQSLRVDASTGISLCPLDGEDPDGLLKVADAQMYQAKSTHKLPARTGRLRQG